MSRLEQLEKHLKPGTVYRRSDLAEWSRSVDRHARQLVEAGVLKKLQNGLYHYPKASRFGVVPADDKQLVRTFLKDDGFLLVSPNAYNSLGLGTTQLYNTRVVYNYKRHGVFKLGGRTFKFQRKCKFPRTMTEEFLLVDLVNNIKLLAEDQERLLKKVRARALDTDPGKLKRAVKQYGKVACKKFFAGVFASAA